MLSASEARRLIVAARCAVVYFTKANGELRRMVCHVPAEDDRRALARKAHLLVWDVEKGGVRTVNLATVAEVKPVATRAAATAAPSLYQSLQHGRTMEEMSNLFAF